MTPRWAGLLAETEGRGRRIKSTRDVWAVLSVASFASVKGEVMINKATGPAPLARMAVTGSGRRRLVRLDGLLTGLVLAMSVTACNGIGGTCIFGVFAACADSQANDPEPGSAPSARAPAVGSSSGHKWCYGTASGQPLPPASIAAMWASSPDDAWFLTNDANAIDGVPPPLRPNAPAPILGVGYSPAALVHWDGKTFCQSEKTHFSLGMGVSPLWHIWGSSADDIYAIGKLGSAIHWDGRSWQRVSITAEGDDLVGITGTGPDNIYVMTNAGGAAGYYRSGRGGDLLRWNGAAWRPIRRPEGDELGFDSGAQIWIDERSNVYMTEVKWATDSGPPSCTLTRMSAEGTFNCWLALVSGNYSVAFPERRTFRG